MNNLLYRCPLHLETLCITTLAFFFRLETFVRHFIDMHLIFGGLFPSSVTFMLH